MGRRFASALIFLIVIAGGGAVLYADDSVRLMVGRSTVVSTGAAIARVSLTSPDIADALVTSSSELLINGKNPGTISMFVWDRAGAIRRYEIVVQRDLARLAEQVKELLPNESIDVQSNGKNIVLAGTVTNKDVIERAVNLASGYVDKKEEVVTLLKLQEGAPTNQVLLRVRFAEVSRTALTELGINLFTSPLGANNWLGRSTTQQFAAPGWTDQKWTKASTDFGADVTSVEGKFSISDFLNLFLFNSKYDLGAAIRLLQQKGLFQSLAEPNLVAESGKDASFLAGGEFPIPVAQGSGANLAISVQFKEFGVRLNFTPTVTGERVHLKVRPEVSSLDFANAVVLNGFRIPALSTRRTETELELQNGQTFAIAGLLNNNMTETLQKIPGIGDIPILGLLFKSKAAQKNRTELVVMITPQILPNNSFGVTHDLPRMEQPLLPGYDPKKSLEMPPAHFAPTPRGSAEIMPTNGSPVRTANAQTGAPQNPDAAAAAARVQALTPGTPTIRANSTTPGATQPAPAVPSAPGQPAQVMPAAPAQQQMPAGMPGMPMPPVNPEAVGQQEHARTEAAKAQEGRARAQEIEGDRKTLEKAAREQAKKDAEAAKAAAAAAKKQAVVDKAASDVAAKNAAEQSKKQAEIDKKNQKTISEAEAKLRAAQAAYEQEVAKTKKQQQQQ
jgi:pilus assembly protein CpaC